MKKMLPAVIVLLVLVGGGSFYGGMKYSDSKAAANLSANRSRTGNFGGGSATGTARGGRGAGRGGAGGFAVGEILSKDSNSLTIKLRDGGSQIVFFSSSTQVMKSSAGSIDDLKAGDNVMVGGSANPDGSVTAQSIQSRPVMPTSSAK